MRSTVLLSALLLGIGIASSSFASNPSMRRPLTDEEKKICENSIVDDGKMDPKAQALRDKQLDILCNPDDINMPRSVVNKNDTEGDAMERTVPDKRCPNCPPVTNASDPRLLDNTVDGSRPPQLPDSLKSEKPQPKPNKVKK